MQHLGHEAAEDQPGRKRLEEEQTNVDDERYLQTIMIRIRIMFIMTNISFLVV